MEENNNNVEQLDNEVLTTEPVVEAPAVTTPVEEAIETAPESPVMEAPAPAPIETAPEAVMAAVETQAENVPAETVTPMPEPVQQQEHAQEAPKKKNNLPLIILILVLLIGGGVCGFFLNNSKDKEPVGEKTDGTGHPTEDQPILSKITYEDVKEIYAKYHTEAGINGYASAYDTFESTGIYAGEKYSISDLKEITTTFANKIYNNVKDSLKDKVKTYPENDPSGGLEYYEAKDIEPLLEKEVKALFGGQVKFSKELFNGCHTLSILRAEDRYDVQPQCGGTSNTLIHFEMKDYELSDDNKELYITEKVSTKKIDSETEETQTYKWTYKSYEKTYVVSTIELVKE